MQDRSKEYGQFRADKNYTDVYFDESTNGLKATHVLHIFDPKTGSYERQVRNILFANGDKIILAAEKVLPGLQPLQGIRHKDGDYNDLSCEIATIIGTGKDGVKRALKHCAGKGVDVAIIYFPYPTTYSEQRMTEGIAKYEGVKTHRFKQIVVIHHNTVHKKSHS